METILEQIISAYKIKCPLFICLPKKLLYQIRNLTVNLRATKKIIFISGAKVRFTRHSWWFLWPFTLIVFFLYCVSSAVISLFSIFMSFWSPFCHLLLYCIYSSMVQQNSLFRDTVILPSGTGEFTFKRKSATGNLFGIHWLIAFLH